MMAWVSTSGSLSWMRPWAIASATWRAASATATSEPRRIVGAKRSSVAANWNSVDRCRCSAIHCIDARMPISMRRTGSDSSPISSCWRRRSSYCASRRISTSSSSLLAKYQ